MLRGIVVGGSVLLTTDGSGLPVVATDAPPAPDGFEARCSWVASADAVAQAWEVVPAPGAALADAARLAASMAASLPDHEAARVPALFGAWYVGVAEYAAGDRVERGGRLYRCLLTHSPRLGTEPEATASIWEPIE